MKRIFDKKKVADCIAGSKYHAALDTMDIGFYLIRYEKGELVNSPFQKETLFQIVERGSINIYLIRGDGTRYALSNGARDYFLGDMELFSPVSSNIYVEAAERLTCIAFPLAQYRETLLANAAFLALVCGSLSGKIRTLTAMDAEPASLTERVLCYMKYKCAHGTLKGIEKAAFHLHCSARQLQRILNQSEKAGLVQKTGKGTYRLREADASARKEEACGISAAEREKGTPGG